MSGGIVPKEAKGIWLNPVVPRDLAEGLRTAFAYFLSPKRSDALCRGTPH